VGVECQTVSEIWPELWDKIHHALRVFGCDRPQRSGIGPVLADTESRTFLQQLLAEGMAVAEASGNAMTDGFAKRVMTRWEGLPPEARSSMASDLANGKRLDGVAFWPHPRARPGDRAPTQGRTAIYRVSIARVHLHAHSTP